MKTLKESLLDDINKTMKNGDKMIKDFAQAETDLKYIFDRINDFNHNTASYSKWYLWENELRKRATIFF